MPTPKPTPEQIQQIKADCPRAELIELPDYDLQFIIRPVRRPEYHMFLSAIAREKEKAPQATERMVESCVLFPSRAELQAIGDDYPAIFGPLGDKVLAISGLTQTVEKKSN